MDTLSIAAASSFQQSKIQNQVDYAILGKTQQIQKQQGDAAVALVEQAVQVQEQLANGQLDVRL
jgi:hypothetical protein